MRARVVVGLVLLFVAVAASVTAAPPAELKPPANEDCLACHGDTDARRAAGTPVFVDAARFAGSAHGPMACVDCHADLATLSDFPHPDKLARVNCASCHDDVGAKYHDSIHARARERSGLTVAPACADCHGRHDIAPRTDPASAVARANIPATCGKCHEGIRNRYEAGVHGEALAAGKNAPVCADCHTAHSIQRTETSQWRLSVTGECGSCHTESLKTFRDTFHGQVTSLGYVSVAACADCHGAHDIHRASDPRSTISAAHRVETCRKCHAGANANFVKFDPHANRHDKARNPALYYAGRFMDGLLLSVFAFFGIHTALWLPRGLKARSDARRGEQK